MKFRKITVAALASAIFLHAALADDAYFHLPVSSLHFTDGALPNSSGSTGLRAFQNGSALSPYAILEGEGEIYLGGEGFVWWESPRRLYQNLILAIRAPKDKAVTGRLFVPNEDWNGMTPLTFRFEAGAAKAESREAFLTAKQNHYRRLMEANLPGGAWFRHQEQEAARAGSAKTTNAPVNPNRFASRRTPDELENTFEIFSGGRAISENLQLDRVLANARQGEETVPITNLPGITVAEMDWKPLLKGVKAKGDPLAAFVPFDQHAIFFPTFSAMIEVMDEADAEGTPVLQLLEPRSEDANSRHRYQKQLCLELNEISRLLGPQVISSVAFTGSDPYLRTGTDVGILFETKSPALLKTFLSARQAAAQQTNSGLKSVQGELEGVAYSGVVSPDRAISSYLAVVDDVVFVSNSLYQMGCLLSVAKGKKPALAAQDEYTFFRNRYLRGEKDEKAFLVLPDAAIRRWCSPQWRIANWRRTWVAAALAEVQAAHLRELVEGKVEAGPLQKDNSFPQAGELLLTSSGVLSSVYGTLDFLTPIAEIPLTKVSRAEADAYNQWRNGYQQNWSQYFDPIAVRVSMSGRELKAELTVMPLIAGSDYRHFISVTSGSRIAPGAGDPHPEAMMHLAFSINPESETIKGAGNFMGAISPSLEANPLGWLGQSISIYADQDPFWEDLGKAESGSKFMEKNYHQLPLALQCEVKNPLGLATFLTALRAFAEQTAPHMTAWQTADYHGQAYVKVAQAEGGDGELAKLAIYYAVTPKSLVLTLSEPLLKRALDRQSARQLAKKTEAPSSSASPKPWLGTNVCLQVDRPFVSAIAALTESNYQSAQQLLSWNNLPILNEWKRLFPAQDALKLHQKFWQTKLVCPGGGTYVWNEKWQTMESTVYGHPGQPKKGPARFLPLAQVRSANLGLSFENQGLSAKAVLERTDEIERTGPASVSK